MLNVALAQCLRYTAKKFWTRIQGLVLFNFMPVSVCQV